MITPETQAHVEMMATVLTVLGGGLAWIIKRQQASIKLLVEGAARQARIELKVDTMWTWFSNHGSDITGYKKEQP